VTCSLHTGSNGLENSANISHSIEQGEAMEWRRAVFERYARERGTARIPNYRLETLGDLTRHLPKGMDDEALLSFACFSPEAANERIREELEHLRSHGWAAEWKVHEFDEPADLRYRLEAHGLAAHHVEALMVLQVGDARRAEPSANGVIVEEASGKTLDEIALLQEEIWKCRLPWLAGVLHEMTDPGRGSGVAYCARIANRIVGSGWIDFHGGSQFAQLCGGAILEAFRGRGIYSLLFERRLAEARRRGVAFIAVDAAPLSRPILERKGFEIVCDTYPMRTRPFDTSSVTRG
jgi:GNAT superfamily N-acetyltransferase